MKIAVQILNTYQTRKSSNNPGETLPFSGQIPSKAFLDVRFSPLNKKIFLHICFSKYYLNWHFILVAYWASNLLAAQEVEEVSGPSGIRIIYQNNHRKLFYGRNHNPTKNNNQHHSRNDHNTVGYFFQEIRIKYPNNHQKLFSNLFAASSTSTSSWTCCIQFGYNFVSGKKNVTVPHPINRNLTGYFDYHVAFSQTKKRVFIQKKQLFSSWDWLFTCFKH